MTEHLSPKAGEPALHRAARLGDHKTIENLIRAGEDVEQVFDIGLDPGARPRPATALMVAAGSPDGASVETLQLLIRLGADPARSLGGSTAARFVAAGLGWNYAPGGDVERLRLLLDAGCPATDVDGHGRSLLADCAATGDVARVQLLLARGADPDAPAGATSSFQIPFLAAAESGSASVVSALLAAGASPSARDHLQRTALFFATNGAVVDTLVQAGLDLEARDSFDWTPLMDAVTDGDVERVRALLDAGANPNATHDRGYTVFMSAVSSSERKREVQDLLLAAGADPLAASDLGWTAFHAAIDVNGRDANTEESVRATLTLLQSLGVDINRADHAGTTPLMRAHAFGTEVEVAVLVELGAR